MLLEALIELKLEVEAAVISIADVETEKAILYVIRCVLIDTVKITGFLFLIKMFWDLLILLCPVLQVGL